ncbi:MAG: WG repeat-containing protein [Cyclobacteriaceae bacterium]|nr:WG repeat-containing protein [Cyclobacteriaceae bacterium]
MIIRYTIVLLFLSGNILSLAQTGSIKRALENLDEGDYVKAVDLLVKAYEKDTLDPEVKYGMSRLYDHDSFPEANLDTAYYFILAARSLYQQMELKEIEKLHRSGLDESVLEKQKIQLDSQAYRRAVNANTVRSYTFFMEKYSSASQVPEAIQARYAAAFRDAGMLHSYPAYQDFFNTYPDAPQVTEARERYERLYFEDKTADGKLSSFVQFLRINPNTPYRAICEREVLELSTAANRPSDFLSFLKDYPQSVHRKTALHYFYHTDLAYGLSHYDHNLLTDSLKKNMDISRQLQIPVYDKDKYSFITTTGEQLIEGQFSSIDPANLCDGLLGNVLFLPGDMGSIIAVTGGLVFQDHFDSFDDLGYGVMKVGRQGKFGAIHKTGKKILPFIYDDIKIVAGAYIAWKQNNRWGLVSIFGREILSNEYDDFNDVFGAVILEKNERYAVVNPVELAKVAEGVQPAMAFIYDEYEEWPDEKLWVRHDEKEGLINNKSGFDIPLEEQVIILENGGYLLEKPQGLQLLDLNFNLLEGQYEEVRINDVFILTQQDNKFRLINKASQKTYFSDSARLLGRSFALLAQEGLIVLPEDTTLAFSKTSKVQLLQFDKHEFIGLSEDITAVYNSYGRLLFEGEFDKISAIGEEYFAVELKGKKGLYFIDGTKVLNPNYDVIAENEQGGVTLLLRGKLGYYNARDSVYIKPRFDKKPVILGNGLLALPEENQYIIIDRNGDELGETLFEEVSPWADSVVLVRKEQKYFLYNPYTGLDIAGGFDKVEYLESGDEKLIEVVVNKKIGIFSSFNGTIIPPAYTFISKVGSVYRAEEYLSAADYYVLVYYNKQGQIIWKRGMEPGEYDAIFCDR